MSNGEKNYFDPRVLARLANLYLKARWVVEGIMSGIHRSRSKGFSVEFEEHREFSQRLQGVRLEWHHEVRLWLHPDGVARLSHSATTGCRRACNLFEPRRLVHSSSGKERLPDGDPTRP